MGNTLAITYGAEFGGAPVRTIRIEKKSSNSTIRSLYIGYGATRHATVSSGRLSPTTGLWRSARLLRKMRATLPPNRILTLFRQMCVVVVWQLIIWSALGDLFVVKKRRTCSLVTLFVLSMKTISIHMQHSEFFFGVVGLKPQNFESISIPNTFFVLYSYICI
jgi:hypothetical protein